MSPWPEVLVGALVITLGFGILTLPVMKFYARPIPILWLYAISCWVFFRVTLLILAVYVVWIDGLGKPANSLSPLVTTAFVCFGGGFLISRDLKKEGYSKRFPGIGARAIFGMIVLSWALVGIVWLVGKFKG